MIVKKFMMKLSMKELVRNRPLNQRRILQNEGDISPQRRHPEHSKKWDDNSMHGALDLISQNPILTLDEIIDLMMKKFNAPHIVAPTLSSYLEFSLITYKNITYHPSTDNSDKTKEQKKAYGEFFI